MKVLRPGVVLRFKRPKADEPEPETEPDPPPRPKPRIGYLDMLNRDRERRLEVIQVFIEARRGIT